MLVNKIIFVLVNFILLLIKKPIIINLPHTNSVMKFIFIDMTYLLNSNVQKAKITFLIKQAENLQFSRINLKVIRIR